jgi:hypothetical protein
MTGPEVIVLGLITINVLAFSALHVLAPSLNPIERTLSES